MAKKAAWLVCALMVFLSSATAQKTLADLEKTLGDWRLGCWGCIQHWGLDPQRWAIFTAGRLSSLGFATQLANTGSQWWVLVKLDGRPVPVLPGLPPAHLEGQYALGVFLGRIPRLPNGEIDPQYLTPNLVQDPPPNVPPAVRIRWDPQEPAPGQEISFWADVHDPDGAVVLLGWDFGDGQTAAYRYPTHAYAQEGTYVVTVTAVDDRGGVGVAQVWVVVAKPVAPPPGGGGGCGCKR